MSEIIIFSTIAGVIGTGIGGVLGAIIGKQNSKIISTILSLAGGVMLAVVFFDLIPESSKIYNHNIVVLLGLVWGIATMIFVNVIVEYFNKKVVVNVLEFKNNNTTDVYVIRNGEKISYEDAVKGLEDADGTTE